METRRMDIFAMSLPAIRTLLRPLLCVGLAAKPGAARRPGPTLLVD
jgi:hypothetical protein